MAEEEKKSAVAGTEVQLTNVRLSFEHVFVPTASIAGGKLKYRATFLMDPETSEGKKNIARCEKAMAAAEMHTFKKTGIKYKDDRCCLTDGEDNVSQTTGEPYEGYVGMKAVSAANGKRIQVVDRNPKVPIMADDDKVYSGCMVNAVIRFYCIKDPEKGGNGCFASLECVQYVSKGVAFGAEPVDASTKFANLGDDDDGIDDDIG
jgi:hypothetical protein